MSIKNPADFPDNDEAGSSIGWWDKALDGVSEAIKPQIERLRSVFTEFGSNQRWYYCGAGADVLPVLLAPQGSILRYVDPAYHVGDWIHTPQFGQELTDPFRKLGAKVEIERPWEVAFREGQQVINIDSSTKVEVFGCKAEDEESYPTNERLDVVYTNDFSPVGTESLISLKSNGVLVTATKGKSDGIHLKIFDKGLNELGFEHDESVQVDDTALPSIGDVRATTDHSKITFQVFRKTREFSQEELDLLRMDSALWDFRTTLERSLMLFDEKIHSPKERDNANQEFRRTLDRYFRLAKQMKVRNRNLLSVSENLLQDVMGEDEIPRYLTTSYMRKTENIDRVRERFNMAKMIYQEAVTNT